MRWLLNDLKYLTGLALITGLLLFGSTLNGQEEGEAARHYTIAIVKDGDSWYFDAFVDRAMRELTTMSRGRYTLSVRTEYDARYNADEVERFLGEALADDSVDMIYAAGIIATERAATLPREIRSKPIMGGALQFSDTRGKPISPDGTSQIDNFTFITNPRRVIADLELLKTVANGETIYVIIDEAAMPEMQNLEQAKLDVEESMQLTIEFVAANSSASEILNRIPTQARAAYVAILPRTNDLERRTLYDGMAERGIINISMLGHIDVELGAMIGLGTDQNQAIARRTALNIHQILEGVGTSSLPVYLPVYDRLLINIKPAQTIGWSPDYDTSLAADFFGDSFDRSGEKMTLLKAMQIGEQHNISVAISREDQTIAEFDADTSRGNLRPRLSGSGIANNRYTPSRINPATTPDSSHQESFGVELTQILFSEKAWSGLRALERIAEAAHLNTLSTKLDAVEFAAGAFLDYLTARKLHEIERENLRLTDNNYQLAQLRIDIGAAEPSESYRWEQNRASDQASLIQRENDLWNALVAFNVQIGAPRDKEWSFEDIEVGDEELRFLDEELQPLFVNASNFEEFGRFVQRFAVANSPELFAFDLQLASQGILLRQSRRWYIPEISGFADYSRIFTGSEFSDTGSENQASLGVQFSVPIFEGGQRKIEILRNKALIRGLAAQRESARQNIEQRALAAFYGIRANHPTMRLSRISLAAAEKNYESIQEKYSQGAATILDLLDAQQALLGQKQQAAVAVYDYLKSLFQAQRAMAWFEHQKSSREKQDWTSLFRRFLSEGEDAFRNFESHSEEIRSDASSSLEESKPKDVQ